MSFEMLAAFKSVICYGNYKEEDASSFIHEILIRIKICENIFRFHDFY
jgi:hypothetical protein